MTDLFATDESHVRCRSLLEQAFRSGVADSLFAELRYRFARSKRERANASVFKVGYRIGQPHVRGYKTTEVSDHMYWGPIFGLQLILAGHVLAGVGFQPSGSALKVTQIQGALNVEGLGQALYPIRWQLALVSLLVKLGQRDPTYAEAQIIRAEHEPSYEPKGGKCEAELRIRMGWHYNVTAHELNFNWCDKREAYYKLLRPG